MAARSTAGSGVHEFVRSHGASHEDRESPRPRLPRTRNRPRNIMNRRRRDDVAGAYPPVRLPGNRSSARRQIRTTPGPPAGPPRWSMSAPPCAGARGPCALPASESPDLLPVPSGGCSVRNRLQMPHGSRPFLSFDRSARSRVEGAGDLPHRLRLCEQRGSRRYPHLWTLLWTRRWGAPTLLR
jgi:hypothetical protein